MSRFEEYEGEDVHLSRYRRTRRKPLRPAVQPMNAPNRGLEGVRRPLQYTGAPCSELEPAEADKMFFPGAATANSMAMLRVMEFCRGCPFALQCRDEGGREEGWWGGMSPGQRRMMLERRKRRMTA